MIINGNTAGFHCGRDSRDSWGSKWIGEHVLWMSKGYRCYTTPVIAARIKASSVF